MFHPKSLRPVKLVIRHLPGDTPAEDISSEMVALDFSVNSVRQLTTKQQPQGGNQSVNLPLLLVEKSPEIFKLTNLSHVITKAEAYRAQAGLKQCYNCQKFRHVWANCCIQCDWGHIHKDCPEKGNYKLREGENPTPFQIPRLQPREGSAVAKRSEGSGKDSIYESILFEAPSRRQSAEPGSSSSHSRNRPLQAGQRKGRLKRQQP